MTAMLAHQGGWDEILLIAVPILAVVGLLALAKRRVDRQRFTNTDPAPVDDRLRPDG